ncbi:hypothetical protein [Elizabethkingia sp. JS20170427COW]|uniref:hypothetical protein n=1 Tax=Elizabethkingia sp. JS20170427COW TaxID=2583851 RepID=UPI0011108F74|nr:hypothetical protein [Elizabethkingia sp. JS20170427COW]QCX52475.1 hypothetical protein FGE20_01295 [Elizabethkingia sp. JS20170427COW]
MRKTRYQEKFLKSIIEKANIELGDLVEEKIDLEIIELAKSFQSEIFRIKNNLKKFNNEYSIEIMIIDNIILQYIWFYFFITKSSEDDNIKSKVNLSDSEAIILRHFSMILLNQFKTLKSIMILSESGFQTQTKILFRNFIESSEKGIAILVDEEYFNYYFQLPANNKIETDIWNKTNPTQTAKIVRNYLENFGNEEFYQIFFDIRKSMYDEYSKSVHSKVGSNILDAFHFKDDGEVILSLIDAEIKDYKDFFKKLILYANTVSQATLVILVKEYKISLNNFDSDGKFFLNLYKINEISMKSYLVK